MIKRLAIAGAVIGFSLTPGPARSTDVQKVIPLGKMIAALIQPADPDLPWSLGADKSSGIVWKSVGVETNSCGSYAACRIGEARISFDGKELKNLRKTIEPVQWDIYIYSTMPAKFSPEGIDISPRCDTVACEFSLGHELESAGFKTKKLCESRSPAENASGFRISLAGHVAYLKYDSGSGSGGTSDSLEISLTRAAPKNLCALDTI